jgi:hypothetical protein
MRIHLLSMLLVLLLFSCSLFKGNKPQLARCLNENEKNLVLRWGDFFPKDNAFFGYEINAYGELFIFSKSLKNPEMKKDKIVDLDHNEFCSKLKLAQTTILKTQTLFSPGENKARFVEFSNPEQNLNMLAVWNPEFQNKGSRHFRELFDSLNSLVPSIREIKNR